MQHPESSAESFEQATRAELLQQARALGIARAARMRKAELAAAIARTEAGSEAPDPPRPISVRRLLEICTPYHAPRLRAFAAPALPPRRLYNARECFPIPEDAAVAALFDNTPGGGGRYGLAVTNQGLHWRNLRTGAGQAARGSADWETLRRARITTDALGDLYLDGQRLNTQRIGAGRVRTLIENLQRDAALYAGPDPEPASAALLTPPKRRTMQSLNQLEFGFEHIGGHGPRLFIAVSGYLSESSDYQSQWAPLPERADSAMCYALRWESQTLRRLGESLLQQTPKLLLGAPLRRLLRRYALPPLLLHRSPWQYAMALDDSWKQAIEATAPTAEELARALHDRALGARPVTLVGFSLGSRVIFQALEELGRMQSSTLVQDVVLMGGAFNASAGQWNAVRRIVGGRLVNVFSRRDLVLHCLYRLAEWEHQAAGLAPAPGDGIDNIDVTESVGGHLRYRTQLRAILGMIDLQRLFGKQPLAGTGA